MKLVNCKKCGAGPFSWMGKMSPSGRELWLMIDDWGKEHDCPVREVKVVSCTYCGANDLWWSKETMENGTKRSILMESYGIPHGCDAQKAFWEAKKEEYAKEKARIASIPSGSSCAVCGGSGSVPVGSDDSCGSDCCGSCGGFGKITAANKKEILYHVRQRIWPGIGRGAKR